MEIPHKETRKMVLKHPLHTTSTQMHRQAIHTRLMTY